MSEYKRFTRSVKHDKRQKQKRKILFFGSLAVLFLIIFVSLILFGNKGNPQEIEVASNDNETEEHDENGQEEEAQNESETNDDKELQDSTLVPADEDEEEQEQEVNIEEIDSDNANVIKAYKGDWKPVGTEQTGAHTIVYEAGSSDRIEIKRAVAMVTDINEDNMIEHWIGRGGDQEVIATVSEPSVEKYYRVYLQWVDTQGWQPTMVEELNHFEK